MTKKDNRTSPLPLDLPQPRAKRSGEVLDTHKPCTLPLTNEITLARLQGRYTEIDRKMWATLVALAWDDLGTKRVHQTNLRDIARLFRELKAGRNGIDWLMASARRQRQCGIDWEDEDEIGTVSLLGGLKIVKGSGDIYYSFDDLLIEKMLDNKQFARLRLHFLIGLSGKYSVDLYMTLEALANRQHPSIEMTIDELRDVMNIEKGKLRDWRDLHKRAIAPAIRQINDNAPAAGFTVAYEPINRGRKVERVRFTVTKTFRRIEEETPLSNKAKRLAAMAQEAATSPPSLDHEKALSLIRLHAPGFDPSALYGEYRQWSESKEPPRNPSGALVSWAKKKFERDRFKFGI